MQGVKGMGMAALAIRFFVELLGIVAVAYWGLQTGPEGIGRIALAVGAAAALIVVWAFVVAPKADDPLRQQARDIIGTVLLPVAAAGLAVAGQPQLALLHNRPKSERETANVGQGSRKNDRGRGRQSRLDADRKTDHLADDAAREAVKRGVGG